VDAPACSRPPAHVAKTRTKLGPAAGAVGGSRHDGRMRQRCLLAMALLVTACGRGSAAVDAGTLPPAVLEAAPTTPGGGSRQQLPPVPASAVAAEVVAVTDGDTIVLRGIGVGEVHRATGGRKARLIGVDTPEVFGTDECFGSKASAFTRAELDGERVRVVFDVGRTDRYGRALVYVWDADGRFFNARLVHQGYAFQLTVPPNVRYASLFTALAREARLEGRGLWRAC
jgi:micrococcal nuclease